MGNTYWVGIGSILWNNKPDYSAWLQDQLNQENKEVIAALTAIQKLGEKQKPVYLLCNCTLKQCPSEVLYTYFKTMELLS